MRRYDVFYTTAAVSAAGIDPLRFSPLFYESGVIVMNDFEMISIFIMVIALVLSAMSLNKNDK